MAASEPNASTRRVRVVHRVAANVPERLTGDETRFTQCVQLLLQNAVLNSPPGRTVLARLWALAPADVPHVLEATETSLCFAVSDLVRG